jgi:hypothetical protein
MSCRPNVRDRSYRVVKAGRDGGARALSIALCAVFVAACGSGPSSPTQTGTTVPTSVPTSTTTSVAPVLGLRYIGTFTQVAPLPSLPLDLSLFFNLPGGALRPGAIQPRAIYQVNGGYNTGSGGFTGGVTGTLDGTLQSGNFTGVMTANLANGCIARRNYSGPLTPQALNWTPGAQLETCSGTSPLTTPVNPPAAPPSSPPTTSIAATTTTIPTSTTTTSVAGTSTTTTGPTSTTTTTRSTTTSSSTSSSTSTSSSSSSSSTSSSSSSTTSSIIYYPLTVTLSGNATYSVTSPQIGGWSCTKTSPTNASCQLSVWGRIELISNKSSTALDCDSFSNNTCTVFMNSGRNVTFFVNEFLK